MPPFCHHFVTVLALCAAGILCYTVYMDEAKTTRAIAGIYTGIVGSATATTVSRIVIIIASMIAGELAQVRLAATENIQYGSRLLTWLRFVDLVSSFLIVFVGTAKNVGRVSH